VRHSATHRFWERYDELPDGVRALADKSFQLLKADSRHPSLHLKRIGEFWSVRVTDQYRAIGIPAPDGIAWIWIGTHREYERRIRRQIREELAPAYT
jgi:hypothetical protein